MQDDVQALIDAMAVEVGEVIDRHLGVLAAMAADSTDLDLIEAALSAIYPAAWVLAIGVQPVDPDAGVTGFSARISPRSQLPWTGKGLLQDVLDGWWAE